MLVDPPPLFSQEWWGHFLVWGVWFPSRLTLEGNRPYLEFWVVILAENPDGSMPAHTKGHEGNLPVGAQI
jgi:hypothetical protein